MASHFPGIIPWQSENGEGLVGSLGEGMPGP